MSAISTSASKQARESALNDWARMMLGEIGLAVDAGFRLKAASDDASFRRYFRGVAGEQTFIFVDAPPEQEDSRPFVHVAMMLRNAGLNAPMVHRSDTGKGFMMLTDFGNRLYFDALGAGEGVVDGLYRDALDSIARMQAIGSPGSLAPYNEELLREEMNLFTDWLLPRQLGLEASTSESESIEEIFRLMVANALEQPSVFVHRDFHCRNLMIVEEGNPGIIDFQDAVVGPVTYDLVSLLKDCYHRFPPEKVAAWVDSYRLRLVDDGLLRNVSKDRFVRWFDLMGMQRHIKVAGIFSRLNLRDGKPRYLADIPLVVDYIVEVCDRYEDLNGFGDWIRVRILPEIAKLAAN